MEQKKQNENQEKKQVMILAVLPGDDCDDTIRDLNEEGFFVTLLSSSGGFLKKKSTTVMIGAREEELDEILGIIKRNAGSRTETVYQAVPPTCDSNCYSGAVFPMQVRTGGATVFVMDLKAIEKF